MHLHHGTSELSLGTCANARPASPDDTSEYGADLDADATTNGGLADMVPIGGDARVNLKSAEISCVRACDGGVSAGAGELSLSLRP